MSSYTHECETDWFEFTLKGKDGKPFMLMPDLKADVEVTDDECEIVRVIGIFTEETDFKTKILTRVYLDPEHDLWGDIEAYIHAHEDELMEGQREEIGLSWHTPRTVDEAIMIGAGEWRRAVR
jgi:hypothetical protein